MMLSINKEAFCEALNNCGKSNAEIAKSLGVTRQTISCWKRTGKIRPLMLSNITEICDFSPDIVRCICSK